MHPPKKTGGGVICHCSNPYPTMTLLLPNQALPKNLLPYSSPTITNTKTIPTTALPIPNPPLPIATSPVCIPASTSPSNPSHRPNPFPLLPTRSYTNSFIPRAASLWNSLPSGCFPSYDLASFKRNINSCLLYS